MGNVALNQWALINKMLVIYKLTALIVGVIAFVMMILAIYFATSDPLVVIEECSGKEFYIGKREKLKISDEDVKQFIQTWVRLRYEWNDYNPEKIISAISPLSTEGFRDKVKELFGKKKVENKNEVKQLVQQSIANVKVTLTEQDAIASFDRIVRINGIPLVVPLEVSLQIIKGSPSRWNALGLYVNGTVEHEDK